jgi:hypothetical protein
MPGRSAPDSSQFASKIVYHKQARIRIKKTRIRAAWESRIHRRGMEQGTGPPGGGFQGFGRRGNSIGVLDLYSR